MTNNPTIHILGLGEAAAYTALNTAAVIFRTLVETGAFTKTDAASALTNIAKATRNDVAGTSGSAPGELLASWLDEQAAQIAG